MKPPHVYVFQGALEVLATLPTQNVTVAELPGLAKNYSKHVIYVCQVSGKKKTTKTQQHTHAHIHNTRARAIMYTLYSCVLVYVSFI
jgi:hypothetical protein